ncbi:MAG: hypothetical protein GKR94_00460 [Gammaproteobacteria bacterium]|nr:hypothetical protein [Gammaproteobacteria bacterium]
MFIVALPRSLSSRMYHLARQALNLKEPDWTTDGEIMNLDRHVAFEPTPVPEAAKFTHPLVDEKRCEKMRTFLEQLAIRRGYAYKDVVQPFVVSKWLATTSGMPVLRIDRPLVDVVYAMLARDWVYPRNAATLSTDREGAVIEGLIRARASLDAIAGAQAVHFDELTVDSNVLEKAFTNLYPQTNIALPNYRTPDFVAELTPVLARRRTSRYRRLQHRCRYIAEQLDLADAPLFNDI